MPRNSSVAYSSPRSSASTDALGVEVADLFPTKDAAAEPVSAGKAEAPTAGLLGLSRGVESAPTEELRAAIVDLAQNLRVGRTYEQAKAETREETLERVLNFAEINMIAEELRRRGEDPPENWLPAYRVWLRAMTPPEEPAEGAGDAGLAGG